MQFGWPLPEHVCSIPDRARRMPVAEHTPTPPSPRHGAHGLHLRVCSIACYAGPDDTGPTAAITLDGKALSVAQVQHGMRTQPVLWCVLRWC